VGIEVGGGIREGRKPCLQTLWKKTPKGGDYRNAGRGVREESRGNRFLPVREKRDSRGKGGNGPLLQKGKKISFSIAAQKKGGKAERVPFFDP